MRLTQERVDQLTRQIQTGGPGVLQMATTEKEPITAAIADESINTEELEKEIQGNTSISGLFTKRRSSRKQQAAEGGGE